MNTETNPAPPPFECDGSRLVDRHVIDADRKVSEADAWLSKVARMTREVETATADFVASLAEPDAVALLEKRDRLANCRTVATAIEAAGGRDGVRHRALHVQPVFDALALGFRERTEALTKLLPGARKELANYRAAMTEAGRSLAEIEFQSAEIAWLRHNLSAIEAQIQSAVELRGYCQRWQVGDTQKTFNDLQGALTAPLPVPVKVPPFVAQPVAA